ncbi:MAG: divalent-cation tolerance protein CutA [Candidatus Omnitrophica bacterium]|nr:divalent-cation tolerance protein CutA [Candidatus Omnitrophota bacterium]
MPAAVILCAAPDRRAAERIARLLVERKLAGCVSFAGGAISLYRWKGRMERAKETLLFIKTTEKNFSKVKKAIEANHPYEVPEILSLPVKRGSAAYLKWLAGALK